MTIKEFFILSKYRFDIGVSFLTIVNLALISISASRVIQEYIKIPMPTIVAALVVCALLGTWLFGYILDTRIRFMEEMNGISNARNRQISKILNNTEELKDLLGVKKR